MEVVKGLETRWEDLAGKLVVQYKKIAATKILYHDDIQRMEEVVKEYVGYKPNRSWGHFARALQLLGLQQQAEVVTTKYVRGI